MKENVCGLRAGLPPADAASAIKPKDKAYPAKAYTTNFLMTGSD
jgi:hypothetical protein